MMTDAETVARPTVGELLEELSALRRQVEDLEQEKQDLELMLEMTTDHSDTVEEELYNKAEDALRESERKLRLIVEATPVPVFITRESDSEILYVNAMAGPLIGIPNDELLGRRAVDFYTRPEERAHLIEAVSRNQIVDHFEMQITTASGSRLWAELSVRRLQFNDFPALLIAMHDITERKKAAEELKAAVDNLTEMNAASSRFVPREFLRFFEKESIADIKLGDHVSKEMTVMFSDVRSFTTISEGMTPQENFDFVNAYLKRVSPVVRDHHGFIVKYLGDGMMAVFPEQADHAVRAGIEKLERVNEYNREREQQQRDPITVGIGINTGHMMVGMVGEASRIQGDAFSDHVNLTSRVEGLTKFYGVSLIVTSDTHRQLGDTGQYHIRFLDKVQVKGKTEALDLYEIYDADRSEQLELKRQTQQDYAEALELYYQQQFADAQRKLFQVLQKNPADKVAWHHLINATQAMEKGISEGWSGVTVMTEK